MAPKSILFLNRKYFVLIFFRKRQNLLNASVSDIIHCNVENVYLPQKTIEVLRYQIERKIDMQTPRKIDRETDMQRER